MKTGRPIDWLAAALIAGHLATVFTVVTTSTAFGKTHEYIPEVQALSPYRPWGCGYSNMSRATRTRFYRNLHADSKLRQQIDGEMVGKGYQVRIAKDGTVSYSKRFGVLSPYAGYVLLSHDGQVVVGASHSKWPSF